MAQEQTNIGTKSDVAPNNTIHDRFYEVNDLNDTINNNSIDAEERQTVLEDTNVSNIASYTTAGAPTTGLTNGTVAFNLDIQAPMSFRDGAWYKLSDNLPVIDPNDLDVYLVLGQSNAEGFSQWDQLTSDQRLVDRTDTLIYTGSFSGTTFVSGEVEQINPPVNNAWEFGGNGFGPELGFSDTVKSYLDTSSSNVYKKRLAILKVAKGGTNLVTEWNVSETGNFMYEGWRLGLEDFQNKLALSGYTHTIKGAIWFQGEADAFSAGAANTYQANLSGFIDDLRDTVGVPDLPFVMAMIDYTPGNNPGWEDTVRGAQFWVSDAYAKVAHIDTGNYNRYTKWDVVHLDAASQYQFGIDCAAMMERAISGTV